MPHCLHSFRDNLQGWLIVRFSSSSETAVYRPLTVTRWDVGGHTYSYREREREELTYSKLSESPVAVKSWNLRVWWRLDRVRWLYRGHLKPRIAMEGATGPRGPRRYTQTCDPRANPSGWHWQLIVTARHTHTHTYTHKYNVSLYIHTCR